MPSVSSSDKVRRRKNAAGEDTSSPAPAEKIQDKRLNAESTKHDESDAFGLHEEFTSAPNRDTSTREDRIRLAAYEAAERRGFEPGFETEDWLEAERLIDAQDQ